MLATRAPGVWRYSELIPVRIPSKVTIGEGGTRLLKSERLAKAVGLRNLFTKNETEYPTGSFKDRCSTVSISKPVEVRAGGVVIGSSGNAAASACAYSTILAFDATFLCRRKLALVNLSGSISSAAEPSKWLGQMNTSHGFSSFPKSHAPFQFDYVDDWRASVEPNSCSAAESLNQPQKAIRGSGSKSGK
jgi:threonine synthase